MILIKLKYLYGWIFVRPRRWLFLKLVWSSNPIWTFKKDEVWHKRRFNIHKWLLYISLFRFCKYLWYDGWRPFAIWEKSPISGNYWLKKHTLFSKLIQWIGRTTAGNAIMYQECYHCGSVEGNPVYLSDGEKEHENTFILLDAGTDSTPEGVDHWFRGITICPKCGFRQEYSDGSL